VADDLTGACDAAVHFASRGFRTTVRLSSSVEIGTAQVVAVSTDSREPDTGTFRDRLAAVTGSYFGSARILLKKIDSTLRGQVGVEIATTLEMFACDVAIVCSAFPALNRVVEGGRLRVTDDHRFPEVDVAELLRRQGLERCVHVRSGSIREAILAGARIVSQDACTDRELDRIVVEGGMLDQRILWVGSGGLAAALARTLSPWQPGGGPRPLKKKAPVLFCIGSDHPTTSAQQAALLARRNVQMIFLESAKREYMVNALRCQQHVCLQIPRGATPLERVRELIGAAPVSAIVLSGGDTASSVCQAVGVQSIELCGEIASGIPYGVLQGGDLDGIAVATKSGGFGQEEALIEIADFFYAPISNDVAKNCPDDRRPQRHRP